MQQVRTPGTILSMQTIASLKETPENQTTDVYTDWSAIPCGGFVPNLTVVEAWVIVAE